jgi:hypothetical protein
MTAGTWSGELSALESRAEIDSLEDLHARRRHLLVQLAPLKALHGPFGTWDAKRKQILEALKIRHRVELQAKQEKTTEGLIDALAHADPQYERFLDESTAAKAEYLTLDNELTEIAERIEGRNAALYAYSSEVRLGR